MANEKEWVKQIFQLVCVVENLDETLGNWKEKVEFDQNSIELGENELVKYAQFDFGGVVVKLAEPIDKNADNPYAKTLREKGQGFHHLGVFSEDYDALCQHFEECGGAPEFVSNEKEGTAKMYNFEKEIGMTVVPYKDMFGPCTR